MACRVRLDFIKRNYTEYKGDDSFLEGAAPSTEKLWDKTTRAYLKSSTKQNGVYDMDSDVPSDHHVP